MIGRVPAWRRRSAFAVLGVALSVLLVGGSAGAASADPDPGLWYFDNYGVQDAHDAGFTGQGVKIAVIDSMINTSVPGLSSANLSVHEPGYCDVSTQEPGVRMPAVSADPDARHGTNMALLLAGNGQAPDGGQGQHGVAPRASILYYAATYVPKDAFVDDGGLLCYRDGAIATTSVEIAESIDQAVADGAQIISMSFTAHPSDELAAAVARAVRAGVVLVAGIANTRDGLYGLNAMNGVVTVQAMDAAGQIATDNVVADPGIDVVGPGVRIKSLRDDWATSGTSTGSSDATAITAGFLAVVKSKYPSATGNQLVQTLIHNTGVEDHELSYDPNNYFGYGTVSLRHMLTVDPAQYPDINPLVTRDIPFPSYDDIYGTTSTPSTPTASEQPAPPAGFVVSPMWIVLGGGLVLLIILAAITVLIVVLIRRRRKETQSDGVNGAGNRR